MFEYQGPIGAINTQRAFILRNFGSIAEIAQPRFEALATDRTVAESLLNGMETFYAALRELLIEDRDGALVALGAVAMVVFEDNVWSQRDRAEAIMRWTAYERDGVTPPEGYEPPAVADGKSFAPPQAPTLTPEPPTP